jgi:hypothetical protein
MDQTLVNKIKMAFTQWQRLRNPIAGYIRIGLILTLPIFLWTHDMPLLIVWIGVGILHPMFIPVYVVAGNEAPLLTRMADAVEKWYETNDAEQRLADIFPCAVMILPAIWSIWLHIFFWAVYFYVAAIFSKYLFIHSLMHKQGDKNVRSSRQKS